MTDRWRRLESLVHAALVQPAHQRAAFLAAACGDDELLRREAESLMAGADDMSAFLESSASGVSLTGRHLGAYRIEQRIGAGGMGEVYRGTDTRLKRDVAVKILPAAWARDPQRRARFEREARAIAALNHPNICTVHDVGREGEIDFLVMEYVDGEPLAARLAHGPLPVDVALARAIEIADALDYAHRRGVIHRDLKPANVMLARAGTHSSRAMHAKLVDFGLARILRSPAGVESTPPTATGSMTAAGAVLGTPQYMAPEQIEGRPADARTDVFAFGALLFEMLTGRRAFDGASGPMVMAAILRADSPPLGTAANGLPPSLERLIHACLAKDPLDRVSSMHDVVLQLRGIADEMRPAGRPDAGASRRRRTVAVAAGLILLAAAALAWSLWPRAPILVARDTILIADFANTTGDTVFDGALKQALAVSLEQSPFLDTLSDARIEATLQLMQRPVDEPITPPVALEICQRQNLKAFIAGAIAPVGRTYAISLVAVHGQTGDVLARELEQAPSKEEVLTAIGAAASSMRARLGEPLASIQKYDKPLQVVTTASLDALRIYSSGVASFQRGQYQEAIVAYTRAIEIDPNFAKAYDSLSAAYGNVSQARAMQHAIERAYALRERTSERERLLIEARYEFLRERDLRAALEHYTRYLDIYSGSASWWSTLAQIQRRLGEPGQAVAPAEEALRRDPANRVAPVHLAWALMAEGRFEEAKGVVDKYENDEATMVRARLAIAYATGDTGGLQRVVESASARPALRNSMAWWQSELAAFEGRARAAREIARRAPSSRIAGEAAVRDAAFGVCRPALDNASGLVEAGDVERAADAALASSWCGDSRRSEAVLAQIGSQYPRATLEHGLSSPLIVAAAMLARGDANQALALLDRARAFDRSNIALFRPQYLRGLAYLRLKRSADADAEFQYILDHRGLAPMSPLFPLAYVGVARAAVIAGDVPRAREYYDRFFLLWKNADPDLPVFVQAKREYAALK